MIQSLHSRARAIVSFVRVKMKLASAYQAVYASPDGALVIADILREAGILSVAHVEGDPGTSAFNDGKRAMALHVVQRLRWSEGELVALARQQTSEDLNSMEGE